MGNGHAKKKGKRQTTYPKVIPKGRSLEDTKHIRLLVLYDTSRATPGDVIDHFCDAVNAFKPSGSLEIKERDIKILQLTADTNDSSSVLSLSESQCTEVKPWISEWLKQNGVVLVCILSKHDIKSFLDDVNLKSGKLVLFSLGKCNPNAWDGCVRLDLDPEDATSPKDFEDPLEELVATVKAE